MAFPLDCVNHRVVSTWLGSGPPQIYPSAAIRLHKKTCHKSVISPNPLKATPPRSTPSRINFLGPNLSINQPTRNPNRDTVTLPKALPEVMVTRDHPRSLTQKS